MMEESVNFQSSKDLKFIVEKLSEILGRKVTMLAFDELSENPMELKRLVNEIIGKITKNPNYKIPMEKKKNFRGRMNQLKIFFFKILKIDDSDQADAFVSALYRGDKGVIFPLIYSLVGDFHTHCTRADIARFAMMVKVPDEMATEPDVTEMIEQLKKLITEYKKVHRMALQNRRQGGEQDPEKARENIVKLKRQKDQLRTKVEEQKRKIQDMHPNWEKLIEITNLLRIKEEKVENLEKSVQNQKEEMGRKKEILEREKSLLHEIESSIGQHRPVEEMVKGLEDQVAEKKQYLEETLRHQLVAINSQVRAIENLHHKPIETVSQELEREIGEIESNTRKLKQQILEIEKNPRREDKEMKNTRRTLAIFTRQKKEKESMLKNQVREFEKYQEMEKSLDEKLKKYNNEDIPTPKQYEEEHKKFRNKYTKGKSMRRELDSLRNEDAILRNTLEILKMKHPQVNDFIAKLSEKKLENVSDKIDMIAQDIQKINKEKEKTLQEITHMVEKISTELEDKKKIYLPNMKKLKMVNKEVQDLEGVYLDKKTVYENLKSVYESESRKMEEKIDDLDRQNSKYESLYHSLNGRLSLIGIEEEKGKREKEYKKGLDSLNDSAFDSYTDFYKDILKKMAQTSQGLIDAKNEVDSNYSNSTSQIDMFESLRILLEKKLESVRKRLENEDDELDAYNTNQLVKKSTVNEDGVEEFNLE